MNHFILEYGEDGTFLCNNCGKSYKTKGNLKRHQLHACLQIGPQFACELCGAKVSYKFLLKRHMKSNCKYRHVNETETEENLFCTIDT